MGILKQNFTGMLILASLSQCLFCMLVTMSPCASWRLHSKLPDSPEDFSSLQRAVRGVPGVMLAHGEDEYEDERGSDIADRGMMMGLQKRGWPAEPSQLAGGCERSCCMQDAGSAGSAGSAGLSRSRLQEMVYRMV